MEEITKYKLKLLGQDLLRILLSFFMQFILIYFSLFFANNMMYFFFIGSLYIGGIYFFLASFVMLWGDVGDKKDSFFTAIIGLTCIIGPTYFPTIIDSF